MSMNVNCKASQKCSEPLKIDQLVANICATYSDGNGINHNEGCNLPRESEILSVLQDLLEIIFPGFGEHVPQSPDNLKYMVGEILSSCRMKLKDVVCRAFRYNCKLQKTMGCSCDAISNAAVNYLLESLPEIRTIVKLDIQAAFDGDPAAKTLDEIVLSYPGLRAITIQRIAHCLYEKGVPLIPRMMGEYAHRITGIDIHPGATLGRGIFIDHGTGVVIGETASIGSGVKIYQGVTLGALSFPKDACGKIIKGAKRHPTIEDDVTLYAGATILGNVTIGKGAVIGGNVWLTENVEPGTKITIAPPELTIFRSKDSARSSWDKLPEEKQHEMLDCAGAILSRSLKVKEHETVLLIYDKFTENVGQAFIRAACSLDIPFISRMIEVTERSGADPDPETISLMMKYKVIIGATKNSLTHCDAMCRAIHSGARGCTLPGITDELFSRSMKADPAQLKKDGQRWIGRLSGKHTVRVVSQAGTNLTFTTGRYPVLSDDADNQKDGTVGNIPAGEAFIAPDPGSACGTIVIDASIAGLPWDPSDGPCIVEMKNGKAVKFSGPRGDALRRLLEPAGEKAMILAEFGIGTNPYLELSGNLLEDEKVRGTIHFAFGNNCDMGGENNVPVHIDGLVREPDLFADGEAVMEKGVWKI